MILTDTHAHLYSEAFDEDREAMMRRAFEAGVERMFIPAIDSSYTGEMLALQASYPENVFLMAGLHPTHVKEDYQEELNHVVSELAARKYYAIGEIGIDLYWDRTYLSQQQEAFRFQCKLALGRQLPIVIHCRDAFDEVFELLEEMRGSGLRGIFHCFTGSRLQAETAIGYGLKLGIGGVVTYKNGKIDTYLNEIPLEHLVLETDAPYLAPSPYRGKRNESAYLVHVLAKLAGIYGKKPEAIAAITTQNSKDVFGI